MLTLTVMPFPAALSHELFPSLLTWYFFPIWTEVTDVPAPVPSFMHDLYCSTSPFCRDHSLLSIHYSTGFSWCHFQLLFLCALFPMGHLLSYCKKYYPTQLRLLKIMHLFLLSTSLWNVCKLYFLEIFSEYFMKVEDLNMPPLIIILVPYITDQALR